MAEIFEVVGVETYLNRNGDAVQNLHLLVPYKGSNDFVGMSVKEVYNNVGVVVSCGDKVKLYYTSEKRWNASCKQWLDSPVLDDIVVTNTSNTPFKKDEKKS